ncbi:hypothetical protein ACQKQD_12885 [Methylobacterium sp. NPDC080182]|uniref:hypothetical protein n=1 Tax=Methylobacterium sp. NPDC080182 TaxID=3390590 RepID=UPI003D020B1B
MADRKRQTSEVVPLERRAVDRSNLPALLHVERLLRRNERGITRTFIPALRATPSDASPEMRALCDQVCREALSEMLAGAAPMPALRAIGDALDEALAAEPDEGVIEACLAALIDTRVKLPHNLPVYLEALIYDLRDEGFPPAVVAAACQRIRRESVFLPEISEVLATCRETLARYREQQVRVVQALETRRKAEAWLADLTKSGSEIHDGAGR